MMTNISTHSYTVYLWVGSSRRVCIESLRDMTHVRVVRRCGESSRGQYRTSPHGSFRDPMKHDARNTLHAQTRTITRSRSTLPSILYARPASCIWRSRRRRAMADARHGTDAEPRTALCNCITIGDRGTTTYPTPGSITHRQSERSLASTSSAVPGVTSQ